MKSATSFVLVLVTTPTLALARKLARAALERRLIACANLLPRIESHYWWQEKITCSKEVLLVLKTRRTLLRQLQPLIQTLHPYETPEIVALPLASGSERYLQWLLQETT